MFIPGVDKLKQYCKIADEDCDNIVALKDTCLAMLKEMFSPHILHKAVVVLNPKQKSIKPMPHSEQQVALDCIGDQMESLPLSHHQMSVNNSDQLPPQKQRHLDEFDDEMNQ